MLEVGPSTGNLTMKILEQTKHVTAIDMDSRMADEVTKRVQGMYVFTLIFNFLTFIFSPFSFTSTPFRLEFSGI